MHDICVKWPAARLLGPDVSQDQALEFIRRTDPALVGTAFTNNRQFEADLEALVALPEDWEVRWRVQEAYANAFGHVKLEHLSSHWVASAYVGGPNGPVSPSGKVRLAKNFGKYPNVAEVETDLQALADAFSWLVFDLSIWGCHEEETEGLPSHTWHLEGGEWASVAPRELPVQEQDVMTRFLAGLHNPMREQTWDIRQIKAMWGEQITAALAQAGATVSAQGED